MIVQASKILNLKIITLKNGEEIGEIRDVFYDAASKVVSALLVKDKGLFNDAQVILVPEIESIGENAVVVQSKNAIKKTSEIGRSISKIVDSNTYLTQTEVMAEGGTNLGMISDIFFDIPTGTVESFEVSQGGFTPFISGKKEISVNDIVTVGKDKLIVKDSTQQQFDQQAKQRGLTGAMRNANQNIQKKAPEVWDDVRSKAGALGGMAASTYEKMRNDSKTESIMDQGQYKAKEVEQRLNPTSRQTDQKNPGMTDSSTQMSSDTASTTSGTKVISDEKKTVTLYQPPDKVEKS